MLSSPREFMPVPHRAPKGVATPTHGSDAEDWEKGLPEEDLLEPLEETVKMQDEDVGVELAAAPPASSGTSISATVFVADSGTCWHRNKFCHLLQGEIIHDLPRPPNDLPPCDVCKDASGSGVQVPESDANSMLDRPPSQTVPGLGTAIGDRPHDRAMRELGPDQRDWWLTRSG